MSKIRLTKNELKGQKQALIRFRRYLPMLVLKKKQLQLEIIKLHQAIREAAGQIENLRNQVLQWVDVFGQEVRIEEFLKVARIRTASDNVAGIDIPTLLGVEFAEREYDLLLTPLWVDSAMIALKETITLKSRLLVYHQQMEILKEELRIATQRVNLFEKVKIPEGKENIRVIQIYLGELQTAGVVRGKIAKAKLERKKNLVGA